MTKDSIKNLDFYYGSYLGSATGMRFSNGVLEYLNSESAILWYDFDKNVLRKIPTESEVHQFIKSIRQIRFLKDNYEPENIIHDGINWSFDFDIHDSSISIRGYHSWPDELIQLRDVMNEFIGSKFFKFKK